MIKNVTKECVFMRFLLFRRMELAASLSRNGEFSYLFDAKYRKQVAICNFIRDLTKYEILARTNNEKDQVSTSVQPQGTAERGGKGIDSD